MKVILIEIRRDGRVRLIDVDGISVASSYFERGVRDLVEKVVELNPDVQFEVVG